MVADVPVGAFLSGGVDSELVVALMQQHSAAGRCGPSPSGFADRAFDESAEAAAVAAHLGTDHTPLDGHRRARPPRSSPRCRTSGTSRSATSRRSPCTWSAGWPGREVTVALSGDGGDELFAGYNRHAWLERLWRRASSLPEPVRRAAGAGARPHPARPGRRRGPGARRSCRLACRSGTRRPRWPSWARCWPPRARRTPTSRWSRTGTTPSRWCSAPGPTVSMASRPGGVAGARRHHRADAVARPGRLPARRHPDQGRPGGHGHVARDPGAVPRPGACSSWPGGCPCR